MIGNGRFVRDAQQVINRCAEVSGRDRKVDGIRGLFVARTVHAAGLHRPASQQRKPALRPVIAAGGFVDLRSPAHVAAHHDQRRVPQTRSSQVLEQSRQRAVDVRQTQILQHLEIVVVRIPVAVDF